MRTAALSLAVALGLAGCGDDDAARERGDRLAALPIAAGSVTTSGISAGGYMAVQFHVAHSSTVSGVGVLAAGPYYCAENSLRLALGRCMKGDEPIAVDELAGLTSELALAVASTRLQTWPTLVCGFSTAAPTRWWRGRSWMHCRRTTNCS
jgi:poly(3-hydroxybutyrate) depolymerase